MMDARHVLLHLAIECRNRGRLTTKELGLSLNVSQQTASRYLMALEGEGLIRKERLGRGFHIRLTHEGVEHLRLVHSGLSSFLDIESERVYEGIIVSGIGEGAYYISEYSSRIREALGYRPFNGTLNIRFSEGRPLFSSEKTVHVRAFKKGGRSFGAVSLTPVIIRLGDASVRAHVIVPERTHHRRDVELVARDNIRSKYSVKDGDRVLLTVG
jgi:riboflavin kinase, archaea type